MKLKLLVAGVMFAASFAASANDYDLGILDASGYDTLGLTSLKYASNFAISDTWEFKLTATSQTSFGSQQTFAVTEGAISGFAGELFNSSNVSLGALSYGINGNTQSLNWLGALNAGTYHVHITGTTGLAKAQYQGAVSALPVPEPETYGMMLGGLALVGVVAARRKAKQAA